jgi:hypothetical protein
MEDIAGDERARKRKKHHKKKARKVEAEPADEPLAGGDVTGGPDELRVCFTLRCARL